MVNRQLQAPLVAALKAYLANDYFPCHFPAHKGGQGWPQDWRELIGEKVGRLDLTELPGLDDLHSPSGPIAAAQEMAAALCGAGQSYFLVNGASVGLLAALLGLCRPGETVLLPRHVHRSLVGAAILSGIRPVFLQGEVDPHWGLPLGVAREELEQVLASFPAATVLVLVYPTYEGVAFDLQGLVSLAHERGLKVVVDEAHGAHFGFHRRFPPKALALGADVVVDGWHKTLGSLTQTAVLHIRGGVEGGERVALALDLLQTTSPSYPLLASLDALRAEVARRQGELWEGALAAADEVRQWLTEQEVFAVWEPGPGRIQDPLRLVVAAPGLGYDGRELALALQDQGRLAVEAFGERHVLLVFSFADTLQSADRIKRAFGSVAGGATAGGSFNAGLPRPPVPKAALTPQEAFFAPWRWLALPQAIGEVAARAIVPYPPGIPLCWPGEVISEELAAHVKVLRQRGYHLQGLTARDEVAVVAA